MQKELCALNLLPLEHELRMMELKDVSPEAVNAELVRATGERFSVPFETPVGRVPVRGRVFFTLNDATKLYTVEGYDLSLPDSAAAMHPECTFPYEPWLVIRLDEAVNLMQGRFIYRKPEIGASYWIGVRELQLMPLASFQFIRSGFEVREFLAETGLGGWLGLSGWIKLVEELERGHRCDLAIGAGSGMRAVKVEAEPLGRRLKVTDRRGKEVGNVGELG
ncbi:MAG TPA: hypothetical protein VGS79_00395 [Puia sp.]|nr:hypothetical protein [Puia sp.]